MKRAVIDIGTNTAHMIIGEIIEGQIDKILYKQRFYTFLGESGLEEIGQEALKRLWKALDHFKKAIENTDCQSVVVLATEGLRSAKNGLLIQGIIREDYGFPIHIIDGHEEADLIFKGTTQALKMTDDNYLIMDIGGGSCEFILVQKGIKVWQESYPIGISRLYHEFHQKDPISLDDLMRMRLNLDHMLAQMWDDKLKDFNNIQLIGCAGTFEIFLTDEEKKDADLRSSEVPVSRLVELSNKVRSLNKGERSLVPDLPKKRAEYIVVALELMRYVIEKLEITDFTVSKYALKEGGLVSDEYF